MKNRGIFFFDFWAVFKCEKGLFELCCGGRNIGTSNGLLPRLHLPLQDEITFAPLLTICNLCVKSRTQSSKHFRHSNTTLLSSGKES